MSKSKVEINLNRLLFKIENSDILNESNDLWRSKYFITTCENMLKELIKNTESKLLPDEIARYEIRIDRVKMLFESFNKENVFEEAKIVDNLPRVSKITDSRIASVNDEVNIKRRFQSNEKIRNILFEDKQKTKKIDDDKRIESLDDELQNDIISKNDEVAAQYTDTLLDISRQFKQQLLASNEIIKKDTRQIETDTDLMTSSNTKIKSVNTSLDVIIKTSWMYGNWILVAVAFIIFFTMVIFMKIF